MTDTAVLFHDGCPDGWCAAWVAYNALKAQKSVVPTLMPVTHGQLPPDLGDHTQVYVVDFAYSKDLLAEMSDGGRRSVLVLDHHQTAIDYLLGDGKEGGSFSFSSVSGLLDIHRSGAGITWDHFWPDRDRLDVVNYVEDRDLWRFDLPRSREVNAYLKAQPYTLGCWDDITTHLGVNDWANSGAGVLLHIQAYARAAATQAYWCEMGGREFPIVNITYESCSDVAEYFLEHFDVDTAGYFFERSDGLWQYGFRSRNGVTVREIAEQFGGGGHGPAAGCQVPAPVHTRLEWPS